MKSNLRILYITKLKNTKANGVTVAVTQLLNSISKYAVVGWIDLGNVDINICSDVQKLGREDWKEFRADIAVFEDPFNSLEFCKIAQVLKKKHIPYILSPHGCFTKIAMQKKAAKKYIAIHTVFRRYLRGCCATQYLCEDEKNKSIQFNRALVIPNGIPINSYYTIKNAIHNIVFISRKDVRHKGIDYLLEAILIDKSLLESKNVNINIYGSTESEDDENYINAFISNNDLSNIVKNNGAVFDKEKEHILMNSDMFILTSRHEGFPMSILEALSYGLPVLITKGTNMTDLVNEASAGWTCDIDVMEIAKTLERALECRNYSDYSINARKLSNEYSWETISMTTIEQYNNIVKKNRGKV